MMLNIPTVCFCTMSCHAHTHTHTHTQYTHTHKDMNVYMHCICTHTHRMGFSSPSVLATNQHKKEYLATIEITKASTHQEVILQKSIGNKINTLELPDKHKQLVVLQKNEMSVHSYRCMRKE